MTRRHPKISVCIDVYNYADFLPDAVNSVLKQDFTDFELVIVDDRSTDSSFEVAQSFADARVIVRQNPENLGMVKNRNAGLRLARGEYVKILHADDYLAAPDALGKMADLLDQHPGMSLAACAMTTDGPRRQRPRAFFDGSHPHTGTSVITRCLREGRNLIGPPSATLFRRERAQRGFDESLFNSADWEMWLHLLEKGCFGFLPEPLVFYRRHAGQQTEKDRATLSEPEDALAILSRYLDKPYVDISRFNKRALRHRAAADLARRSKQLGRSTGELPLTEHGTPASLAARAGFFLSDLYCRQLRTVGRLVEKPCIRTQRKDLPRFPAGLNVAGFFQGEYGIGDSSRAIGEAIRSSQLPSVFLNIHSRNHRNQDRSFEAHATKNPFSVNLMTFSFDYARRFARDAKPGFFRDRYNIALWYWELEKFPERWHERFNYYDEIWTTTSFCQKSLSEVSPVPVVNMGYPFAPEPPPPPDRPGFGLEGGTFLFLFNFDFHSVVERKNPEAVINAFRQAFGEGQTKAGLVLKSINAHRHPERAAALEKLGRGLNIVWVKDHLEGQRMKTLFATADCYVSLHRSEGLGLGMARAMSYGKPVIATGYSGNLDFTTPENSLLVSFTPTEIPCDHGVYEKGNFWAEANIDHAAQRMRQVFENPDEARRMGLRGQKELAESMDPQRVIERITRRLGEIDPRLHID